MTDNNLPALDALADRINSEHEACHASMQKGLEHALKAGTLLLEVKAGLPHGEWLPWLGKNCPEVKKRTAQAYMRLARELPKFEPEKAQRVAHLSMRDAVKYISQGVKVVADLQDQDIDVAFERIEQGDESWLPHVAKRIEVERLQAESRSVPVALVPVTDAERKITVRREIDERARDDSRRFMWTISKGPNLAGMQVAERVEALRGQATHKDRQAAIDEIKARAARLRAEAEALEQEAVNEKRHMDEALRSDLETQHGPAHVYTETLTRWVDEPTDTWLATLDQDQAVRAITEMNAPMCVGFWGDMRLASFSRNHPGAFTGIEEAEAAA